MDEFSERVFRFSMISSEVNAAYHMAASKLGMADSEMHILYILCVTEGASQREIARQTGLSKQTIHSAVQKLVNEGVIDKPQGNRNERLLLSDCGKETASEKIGKLLDVEKRIFGRWDPSDQEMFVRMHLEYLDALRREVEEM